MKKLRTVLMLCIVATLTTFAPTGFAQDSGRSYTEGSVVSVSYIRTEPGRFDDYMKYLSTTYKGLMEEYKKAGIILDWAVYATTPENEHAADVILTTTYKNLGAMDNLDARMDPIAKKVWSSVDESNKAFADRGKMRTSVGGRLLRQMILK
ncbi:MAG TPA: hypothetical protein P5528_12405 [Steroidobacteraceae bacterium]|nr:hypothetical protein [Steroidobacteraceae bacterium]HRX90236.1 hypothetical protein [Steroidobacteraceae bacterium]